MILFAATVNCKLFTFAVGHEEKISRTVDRQQNRLYINKRFSRKEIIVLLKELQSLKSNRIIALKLFAITLKSLQKSRSRLIRSRQIIDASWHSCEVCEEPKSETFLT